MTLPQSSDPSPIALVTGAASGIGRATALLFAHRGYRIVANDVDAAGLASLAAELGERLVLARVVDVADRAAMNAFAAEVHQQVPALDVLVNNAGVAVQGGMLDTSLDNWDWILGINLKGVIHGCHFFVPPMVARGRGHVVNVSSIYGCVAGGQVAAYATSKFGVFGLSESLRSELKPKGIGVTTICPGMIATNIVKSARFTDEVGGQVTKTRVVELFERRGSPPERVAAAIVDAIDKKKDVVPVAPEAWVLYGLKRLAPRVAARVVGIMDEPKIRTWLGRR